MKAEIEKILRTGDLRDETFMFAEGPWVLIAYFYAIYNCAHVWSWIEIISSDVCSDRSADARNFYDTPAAYERPAEDDQPAKPQLTTDVATRSDIVYANVLPVTPPVVPAEEASPITYANLHAENGYSERTNDIYANAVP